jgi:hypothetical protein
MRVPQQCTACQESGVPDASPVVAGGVSGTVAGRFRGVAHVRPCHKVGCWGASGRMTVGSPGIISIACAGDPSSDRVGTRPSNQELKLTSGRPACGAKV